MELTDEIMVQRTTKSRLPEVDFNKLGFGNYISDHMLICYYKNGQWEAPSIVPFADISISPATLALHYGQSVFEGLKAFRLDDGRVNLAVAAHDDVHDPSHVLTDAAANALAEDGGDLLVVEHHRRSAGRRIGRGAGR